jgi:hypothetical protein
MICHRVFNHTHNLRVTRAEYDIGMTVILVVECMPVKNVLQEDKWDTAVSNKHGQATSTQWNATYESVLIRKFPD